MFREFHILYVSEGSTIFALSQMAVSRSPAPLLYALADLFALVLPLPKQLPACLL